MEEESDLKRVQIRCSFFYFFVAIVGRKIELAMSAASLIREHILTRLAQSPANAYNFLRVSRWWPKTPLIFSCRQLWPQVQFVPVCMELEDEVLREKRDCVLRVSQIRKNDSPICR